MPDRPGTHGVGVALRHHRFRSHAEQQRIEKLCEKLPPLPRSPGGPASRPRCPFSRPAVRTCGRCPSGPRRSRKGLPAWCTRLDTSGMTPPFAVGTGPAGGNAPRRCLPSPRGRRIRGGRHRSPGYLQLTPPDATWPGRTSTVRPGQVPYGRGQWWAWTTAWPLPRPGPLSQVHPVRREQLPSAHPRAVKHSRLRKLMPTRHGFQYEPSIPDGGNLAHLAIQGRSMAHFATRGRGMPQPLARYSRAHPGSPTPQRARTDTGGECWVAGEMRARGCGRRVEGEVQPPRRGAGAKAGAGELGAKAGAGAGRRGRARPEQSDSADLT